MTLRAEDQRQTKLRRARASLIAGYRDAFLAANPTVPAPEIEYKNGYYYLRSNRAGAHPTKYRPKTVEKMRDRLVERALEQLNTLEKDNG